MFRVLSRLNLLLTTSAGLDRFQLPQVMSHQSSNVSLPPPPPPPSAPLPPPPPQQHHQPSMMPSPVPASLSALLAPSPSHSIDSPISAGPNQTSTSSKTARSPNGVHSNIDTLVEAAERKVTEHEQNLQFERRTSQHQSPQLTQTQHSIGSGGGGRGSHARDSSQQDQRDSNQHSQQYQHLQQQQRLESDRFDHVADLKAPDPIDLLVLGEPEARSLFEFFLNQLNPLIKILDPILHTFEYVRQTSTVLFTSMLAVSAKFHRPDLQSALLAHAQHLHARGQIECQGGIGLVQGIAMLCYWKEPKDQTVWSKTGWIVRYAYMLKLHSRRRIELPQNQFQARLILDRERTWLNLICFERVSRNYLEEDEDLVHIPSMVQDNDLDLDKWLEEGERRGVGLSNDRLLCSSVEHGRIQNLCPAVQHATSPSAALLLSRHVEYMLQEALRKYIAPSAPSNDDEIPSASYLQNRMAWANMRARLRRSYFDSAGHADHQALPMYLEAVADVFDTCAIVVTSGALDRIQDITSFMIYRSAQGLVAFFPILSFNHQASVMTMLKTVYQACSDATGLLSDDTRPAAYLQRFLRVVIRALTIQKSGPPTRSATPRTGGRYHHHHHHHHYVAPASSSTTTNNGGDAGDSAIVGLGMSDDGRQSRAVSSQTTQDRSHGFVNPFSDIIGTIGNELVPELFQADFDVAAFDPMAGMRSLDQGYWEGLLPAGTSGWQWLEGQ
ncbi:hypothetical protein OIO90_003453 [Microbotryomycetes sp. JL221]|nr:hypothetical protein OIO90_003453 [Microbotryomycetes sp. JL221]